MITWTQGVADTVLATALAGNLPALTGKALNFIRANAAEDGGEFRTPAQVLSDIGAASTSSVALKAPLDDPILTGTVTAPTPTAGNNSDIVATTAFIFANVGAATAALAYGDVGTYGFFVGDTADQVFNAGSTYAGSLLRPAGISQNAGTTSFSGGNMGGQPYQTGSSPSGTWRAMGSFNAAGGYAARYTVFLRIS
jgi:hypothetical protein